MSVLANATFPFSGLNLNSGFGSIALIIMLGSNSARRSNIPDERVYLLNGMLNFMEGIGRFDAQFKDKSVDLVYNQCNFDALL